MALATDTYVKAVCVDKCPDQTYSDVADIPVEFCLPGATQGDAELCPEAPLYKSLLPLFDLWTLSRDGVNWRFRRAILHRCTPSDILDKVGDEAAKQAQKITEVLGEDPLETLASEVGRSWREIVYIFLVGVG